MNDKFCIMHPGQEHYGYKGRAAGQGRGCRYIKKGMMGRTEEQSLNVFLLYASILLQMFSLFLFQIELFFPLDFASITALFSRFSWLMLSALPFVSLIHFIFALF